MTHIMQKDGISNLNGNQNRASLYNASSILPSNSIQQQVQQSIQLPSMGLNPVASAKRSLNREARKRQLLKITMEN
jgi:hypothetical protein